jgi:hypothetical protein
MGMTLNAANALAAGYLATLAVTISYATGPAARAGLGGYSEYGQIRTRHGIFSSTGNTTAGQAALTGFGFTVRRDQFQARQTRSEAACV